MNGPEHYREAEWSLVRARQGHTPGSSAHAALVAEAHAHATLALAAAQVEAVAARGPGDLDPSWRKALGWETPT